MNHLRSSLRPLALAALVAASSAAHAELTLYTDEASFLAAISNAATDTFDDLAPGVGFDGPVQRSAGIVSYTVSSGPNSNILYGAGTVGDPWLSSNNARDTITFDGFSAGTYAAGANFFGSDIDGNFLQRGVVIVSATDTDGSLQTFRVRASESTFIGFVSDEALTSLSVRVLSLRNNPVWPTVDNLTVAAVPEPGTYAMLLAGLGVLGFLARRRQG